MAHLDRTIFKLNKCATCATFCRRLLELNAGGKTEEQARTLLMACEKNPSDAVKLNYDPRNPFDLCALTFTPIYQVRRGPLHGQGR
ncbi:hypothetical protein GPECTOR_1057g334 [Gonium pectorale]|uniref:Coatomer alpha subunit C-terminal domain-containing protein n=1 Tax=Gonium pectorale TaxID=33097 RepID=A0A150FTP1_GONPE|nr:hypothetical protein GPECTOR_1057g334 [Gonium pectorale]|eukprot:KXZ40981.1 hypothetical protein GPECTOR_1057g334 [Gonium pectorale]